MSTHTYRFPQLHMYARTQEAKRAERERRQGPHEIPPEIEAMSAHPGVRAMTPSQAVYTQPVAVHAADRKPQPGTSQTARSGARKRHPWNASWQESVIDHPVLAGAQESYESEHATVNPFRGKDDPSLLFTRHYQKLSHQGSGGSPRHSG